MVGGEESSRGEMISRIKVVGAAVRSAHNKILICRRVGKSLTGMWEFPGGKVEPGESEEEALAREFLEELGVPIAVGPHLATGVQSSGDSVIELSVFEARLVDLSPTTSSDHDALEWVDVSDLKEYQFPEADLPAVRALLARAG